MFSSPSCRGRPLEGHSSAALPTVAALEGPPEPCAVNVKDMCWPLSLSKGPRLKGSTAQAGTADCGFYGRNDRLEPNKIDN